MKQGEYRNMADFDHTHWYFLGMKRIMISILDMVYKGKSNLKILDAGAGTGWFTETLSKYGDVTALDISEEALRFCRERGIKNIIQADVAKIPAFDNTFDLIICSEVLYHKYVKDDLVVLKEFYRVLKPGGRLLVKVPAHSYLWGVHDTVNLTRQRYEPQDLERIFLNSGFVIERMTYANFFLFPIVYLKRKMEKKTINAEESDIKKTLAPVNFILLTILRVEAFLLKFINLPQGSSLICLGRK